MSDAKVTFKIDDLQMRVKALAAELRKDKFGKTITDEIVKKIRKDGYNFKTGGKHKPLPTKTIERRKKLAQYNKTHPDYKASKSNLTFTGRLLNSIKARITSKKSSIVLKIDVSGTHAPYKYKGKEMGGNRPNKIIREGLAKMGRDPLGLTEDSKNKLSRILIAIMKERLFK